MPRIVLILFSILFLGACTTRPGSIAPEQLPVPESSALSCCWQSHDQVTLLFEDQQHQMTSVTAIEKNKLTFVLLDQLGRRVLTLIQTDNSVSYDAVDEIKKAVNPMQLLASIHLAFTGQKKWLLDGTGWSISKTGYEISLLYQDKPQITRHTEANTSTLRFAGSPVVIRIRPLTRTPL